MILVIDDDPVFRLLVNRVAVELGRKEQLHLCSDLAGADAYLREHTPGFWVVDIHLPDGSGNEWVKKQRSLGRSTRALLLSHSNLGEQGLEALQPCTFKRKPTSLAELRDLMKSWNTDEA